MNLVYVVYHEYARLPIHTAEVVEQMARQGHQVSVVTAVSPRALAPLGWHGVTVRQVPLVNLPRLRTLSFLVNACWVLPWVFLRKRPDVVYERFSLTTPATRWISRLFRLPLVVEVNGIVADELALGATRTTAPAGALVAGAASRARIAAQAWIERLVFRGSERLIAVTEGIRQWIHEAYGVPLERIRAIPNATNPERFHPMDQLAARAAFGLDSARPVVGYLGSLFPWSGLEVLVEASPQVAAQVPDVLFVIGGGQPALRAALERRVHELGMDGRFHFAGDVPWSRAAEFISAFDLAVAPAKFSDGRSGISPQKVYAYLACERPVVGSDLKGLGDLLTAHRVGLSFPSGDAAALAQALIQLLQQKAVAAEMGQRGRALVLERFTWEQVVGQTMKICADAQQAQKVSDTF